jgi:hypothetical protein
MRKRANRLAQEGDGACVDVRVQERGVAGEQRIGPGTWTDIRKIRRGPFEAGSRSFWSYSGSCCATRGHFITRRSASIAQAR